MNVFKKFIFYFIGILIITTTNWLDSTFTGPTTEQIIFQTAYLADAIDTVPKDLSYAYYYNVLCAFLMAIVLVILDYYFYKFRNKIFKQPFFAPNTRFDRYVISKIYLWFFIASIIYFSQVFSVHLAMNNAFSQRLKYQNYVNPQHVEFAVNNPKNLILIYMESMEDTYKDTSIFRANLLKKLYDIKGVSFAQYKQRTYAEWTAGAMFATQCGTLVNVGYLDHDNYCLSDVLDKFGYHNVYMQGASLDYTKTGEFLKKHKFHELYGREEWKQKGYTNFNNWGLYDEELFAEAKIRLKELQQSKKLFNLTMLTVNTHGPEGFLSENCKSQKFNDYGGIVECSINQIADFVNYLIAEGFLENTNIVLIGDHLFLNDSVFEFRTKDKRNIFNRFISNEEHKANARELLQVDIFPTVLDFIGIKLKSGKIAKGISGFRSDTNSHN